MIHEVDSALRALIERGADGMRDVEIVFDAPTKEWAGRRNAPTVDVYLYDIREDLRRRERGMHNEYDENRRVVGRHLPPRHFKLSYLVTAWTQRPEDEHRLLSSLLTCFLRYDALPAEVLTGPLSDLGLPVPITIALPPPEDRAFADVWSALGGELKPSIDLVVITPLDTGQQFHTGPPVSVPPQVSLGGSDGWPTREAKSRNGVEVWPVGTDGPTPGSALGRGGVSPHGGAGWPDQAPAGDAAGEWDLATAWADAMAPLGSQAAEPLPDRVAGRSTAQDRTTRAAGAGPLAAAESVGDQPGGDQPGGSGKGGAAGGRPGRRVRMTRVQQTKKRS